jgi:3-deoxy-D-manno-octulosonic-acid transferase/heptosyltransferase-1
VVHSLPLLEVLKRHFPEARIDWLVEESAAQIIEGHPALDRVIISRRKPWQRRLRRSLAYTAVLLEIGRFLKEIRSREYDLVIDLQGLLKSGILTGLTRGRRKIGMDGAREGGWLFFNERPIAVDYDQHAIDRYLKLGVYLDCEISGWQGRIPVFEPDKRRVDELLQRYDLHAKPLVAVNPVARWKTKLWRPERFAVVADKIKKELNHEVVFTGSAPDSRIIQKTMALMQSSALSLAGQTSLKSLAYFYSRCRTLLTTDTGPMHMAVAMGIPVVALFGPTAPWRTGPYGAGHAVIRADLDCGPCFKKKCENVQCMDRIMAQEVFESVKKVLESKRT